MIEILAIVLIWGYVLGFLYLTVRTSRRSGKRVWLFSEGRERQALPAVLFRAAFVLGGVFPLITLLLPEILPGGLADRVELGEYTALLGLLLMAIGGGFALYAQSYMGSSWRIGAAEGQLGAMVSGGPFAYSRNPVFVGQIVLFAGLALVHATIPQVTLAIIVVVAASLQVRIEERVLEREMETIYSDYRRRVRRWI